MDWKLAAAEKLASLEVDDDEEDQFLTLLPADHQAKVFAKV